MTVMYGCDNFCSYCCPIHGGGEEQTSANIISEIKALRGRGLEVTLLGQNVNSYKQC